MTSQLTVGSDDTNSEEEENYRSSFHTIIQGPLSKKYFLAMITLEQQISQKLFYSMQSILDLVEMYGRCVEHFDINHDSAKWYFMEKIQTTLAESKTHELLLTKEKEKQELQKIEKQLKPMVKEVNISQNPLLRQQKIINQKELDDHSNSNGNDLQMRNNINHDSRTISIRQIRETRKIKLTILEEVHKGKEQQCSTNLIDKWDQDVNQTGLYVQLQVLIDQIVMSQLKNQSTTIQNRLQKRKSYASKQMDNSKISMESLAPQEPQFQDQYK